MKITLGKLLGLIVGSVILAAMIVTIIVLAAAVHRANTVASTAATETPASATETDAECVAKAKTIGAPLGSSICNAPISNDPVVRAVSGDKIGFGTITFDAETRVWILEKFVVPSYANYSFDYTGREQYVLNAPFVVGSELSPVTGQPFEICWDTTSNGCIPPVKIEFFQ